MPKINTKSLANSTTATIIFVVILTLWSELSKPFKEFLAGVTGHHWVTKGVFSIIFFAVLYFILSRGKDAIDDERYTKGAIWTAVLGAGLIFIFYFWHFLSE